MRIINSIFESLTPSSPIKNTLHTLILLWYFFRVTNAVFVWGFCTVEANLEEWILVHESVRFRWIEGICKRRFGGLMDYSIPSKVRGCARILHMFYIDYETILQLFPVSKTICTDFSSNFVCQEGVCDCWVHGGEEDEVVWGMVVEECHEGMIVLCWGGG